MSTIRQRQKGFTIVELLVVIVVIGILAAITIVAYNGVSERAIDSRRKSELGMIAKAFQLHAIEKNNGRILGAGSGCGYFDTGTGYFGGEYTNLGVEYTPIRTCLAEAGYPTVAQLGRNDSDGYMRLDCKLNGVDKSYLLGPLSAEPQKPNMIEELCNPATSPKWGDVSFWDDRYGMNYSIDLGN